MDYHLKDVVIDGKPFEVVINVFNKADGSFVYEVKLRPNKKRPRNGPQLTELVDKRRTGENESLHRDLEQSISNTEADVKPELRGLSLPTLEDTADIPSEGSRENAETEFDEAYSASDEEAEPPRAKKPVAESKPIIAKSDLRRAALDIFSIPEGRRAEMGKQAAAFRQKKKSSTCCWGPGSYSRQPYRVLTSRKIYRIFGPVSSG